MFFFLNFIIRQINNVEHNTLKLSNLIKYNSKKKLNRHTILFQRIQINKYLLYDIRRIIRCLVSHRKQQY